VIYIRLPLIFYWNIMW